MQTPTICEVSRLEDQIAAQNARDERNATLVQDAIRAIPKHQFSATVALEIMETLQSAFIQAKNIDLDGAVCELDSVLDALYLVTEQQKQLQADAMSDALRAYNPYTDV